MKKLIMLAGIVAAVIGVKKLLGGGKHEDNTFASEFESPSNGYAPQPQQ